mgnify:CR=1 FL=1
MNTTSHGGDHQPRELWVGAAQLGPITRDESRSDVVDRLLALLRQGAEYRCDLVVFPELALTTFFPRWILDDGGDGPISGDTTELDSYYELEMPSRATQALFDEAKRLAIGFCLGYAELTPHGEHYNTSILTDQASNIVARYRKIHLPGHVEYDDERAFQHLEKRYFLPGDLERQIGIFVEHYNNHRYHESLDNLTPADVYHGRGAKILKRREEIKKQTIRKRRLQHQTAAA